MNYLNLYKDDLVEINYDDCFDASDIGYIVAEDDDYILLHFVNSDGILDGYNLIYKDTINCLRKNSRYLMEVSLLEKEMKKTKFDSIFHKKIKFKIPRENLILNLLYIININNCLCKIAFFDGKTFFGFVKSVHKKSVLINYLNEEKEITIDSIKHIYFDTIKQKRSYFLDLKSLN